MSKKLEDFIRDHKNSFDDYTPSDALWQHIESRLDSAKPVSGKGRVFHLKTWMKAAAVIALLITTALVSYNLNRSGQEPSETPIAGNGSLHKIPDSTVEDSGKDATEEPLLIENSSPREHLAGNVPKKDPSEAPGKNTEEDELYHYVKLIEIKQGQMKELKKTEPELYKEFSKDAEMLETSYGALKAQLSKGVNSEKLLEAMIGNLKMQADLLNKQLEILKQVHKKKNSNDEKNYKNL